MGTIKDGILGGVSGRIGNLVGATWKDIHYIRTRPAKVRDAKTEKQLSQRSSFSVTMDFLKRITPFIRIGFQAHATGRMTAFNAAMSYNMKHAVTRGDQGMALDWPNVLISKGTLGSVTEVSGRVSEWELHLHWDTGGSENSWPDDIAMVVANNTVKGRSIYDLNASKRASGKASLPLPAAWEGDTIETYLAFKTDDGAMVSNSIYIGQYVVS